MKKKIIGSILLLIGIGAAILGIFMQMGNSRGAGLIKEAVYVGESALQAENDGKLVIVTGELRLTEPAYDSELGITFNAPKVAKEAQNLKWLRSPEKNQGIQRGYVWLGMDGHAAGRQCLLRKSHGKRIQRIRRAAEKPFHP